MFRIEILNILIILIMNVFCIREIYCRGEARVVGGRNVEKSVPYQISLQMKIEDRRIFRIPFFTKPLSWSHICGGSIIGKLHILTAAHCVDGMDKDMLTVVVGTILHEEGGVRHFIDWIIMHPGYKKLETSDIAIITLKTPIKFNRKVKPIKFTDEKLVGEEPVILTGWGYSWPFRFGSLPDVLQIIEMKTLTNENCNETGHRVTPTEICAFRSFLSGACAGDSGGPLVNIDQTKQIGVVSYGTAVCGIGFPDVFTRVSVFVSWIGEQMAREKPPDGNDTSTGNDSTTELPPITTTIPATTPLPTTAAETNATTTPTLSTEIAVTEPAPTEATPTEATPTEATPTEATTSETRPLEATPTEDTTPQTVTESITTTIPLSSTSESDSTAVVDATSEPNAVSESNTEVNNGNEVEANTEAAVNVEATTPASEGGANKDDTDNKETDGSDVPDAETED